MDVHCVNDSVVDPKLFFSDPDPTFQEISDPENFTVDRHYSCL